MNYFPKFWCRFCENRGCENFVLFRCGNVSPLFCWSSKFAFVSPSKLPAERGNSCLHRIMCDFRSTLGVFQLLKNSCASLLMVLFLRSIITDWQDENKRTKKLGSQIWKNLCSLYSNKCLHLASEKLVLASGSNLSLATGLASWKVTVVSSPGSKKTRWGSPQDSLWVW